LTLSILLPFANDLDKDVEEFIVSWARELPRDLPFTIIVSDFDGCAYGGGN
jgi:hypothetical protein